MITFIQMPTVPFDWMVQRPQQIMINLSKMGNVVYYMENKNENYIIKRGENLYVTGNEFDFSNLTLNRPIVLWCSSPEQVVNIDKIPHDFVVYDALDDASEEFIMWSKYIDPMVARADLMFTSAQSLYNKFKLKHSKVHLVNNGVDVDSFSTDKKIWPNDLPRNKRIVGYVGAIAPWIDWNLVNHIVKNGKYNFVFVGPSYNGVRPNILRSNVYFLGLKNHHDLPYYVNNFDCCIIPFKINSMTNACNPIKLYEYMSLGKPVVSTAMHEVCNFSHLCYVSKDKDQFEKNITKAIEEKDSNKIKARMSIASNNSWYNKASVVLNTLKNELNTG